MFADFSNKRNTRIDLLARCVLGTAIFALILCGAPNAGAVVVTDDFSDGDDTANPAWTHLDGLVGSSGQTWDASTGRYRLTGPTDGINGLGFVGSHFGPSFTDVRVSMDLVEFDKSPAPTPGEPNPGPNFIHIMARVNGDNSPGGLTGYAYGYDPLAAGGDGEMVLFRVNPGPDLDDIYAQRVTLDQSRDYRFVLEVLGNTVHGQVFDLTAGGVLVAESFQVDTETPYESGTSGTFAYTQTPFTIDYTVDNFRAETIVAGDYNDDGSTDAADYVVWRKTVGQTTPQLEPDPSFQVISLGAMMANGAVTGGCNHTTSNCEVIDEADYGVWSQNFGASANSGGGGAVPEPSSGLLLLLGLSSILLHIKRRF